MKKKELTKRVLYQHFFAPFKQNFLLLNYTVILTLVLTLNATAKSYSQGEKIDLAVQDVKLKTVFPMLEQKGKIRLMYSEDGGALDKLVSIQVKDTPVLRVLEMLLSGTNLEYKELGNDFVVVRNKAIQQEITIRGTVRDASGQPLGGISVLVQGTSRGAGTDENGQYTISAAPNAVLVFSSIGYVTQTIAVNSRTAIDVVLADASEALGEVVVTALGITRERKSLSYSVSQVDGEDMTKAREISLGNALTGRVAGVNASSTATGPGGSSRIIIRGNGTLNGDNQPLIVVNGVPIDNTNRGAPGTYGGADRGDGLSAINPDDIESVSVLKGGPAAALYGSRAANGVILITTKSGQAQRGIGIEYNSTYTMETPLNLLDWQYEYGAGTRGEKPTSQAEAIATGRMSWGAPLDGSMVHNPDGELRPYTAQRNNIQNFYNTGNTFSNTLAINGGSEAVNFRFSASNIDNSGILPNNSLNIRNFNLGVNAKLADKIVFEGRAQYGVQENHNRARPGDFDRNANTGVQIAATNIDVRTLAPGYDEATGNEFVWSDYIYVTNPYFVINKVRNADRRRRFLGSFNARYLINDDLYLSARLGIDHTKYDANDIWPSGIAFNNSGQMTTQSNLRQEINGELILGYNKTFGNFSVNAMVGGNQMTNLFEGVNLTSGPFNIPFQYFIGNGSAQNFTLQYSKWAINSLFGSADVGFNNYLYLTLSARQDWFSTLDIENNSLLYPSAGLSFVASEAWRDRPSWLNFLKLRASWAQVGGGTPNPYGLDLQYSNSPQLYINGATLMTITSNTIPNKLNPYTSTTSEAGIEGRILQNRLGFDLTVYDRTTTNDIVNASVPSSSGFTSVALNVGEIRNRGVEVLLTGTPVRGEDFTWDVAYNMAYNKNTVLKIADGLSSLQLPGATTRTLNGWIYHYEGQPFGMIAGNRVARNDAGQIIYNPATGLPIQGPIEPLGLGVPPWTMGITNTFSYKNINLNVLVDGKFGGSLYSATQAYGTQFGLSQRTVAGGIRETGLTVTGVDPSGAPFTTNVTPQTYYSNIWSQITEEFVTSADFIKLRSVTLGYSLPNSMLSKTPFQSVSLSFVARNLLILLNRAEGVDPEASYSSGNAQGLENFGLPTVRSYGFNLMVRF